MVSRLRSIDWFDGKVRFIDQTKLPTELVIVETDDHKVLIEAIKKLKIRGAPAIGIAAGFGIYLGIKNFNEDDKEKLKISFENVCDEFAKTRPTAVNLFWAIERMKNVFHKNFALDVDEIKNKLLDEALSIQKDDIQMCKQIGLNGAMLIPDKANILTHCNTGWLATGDYGTALGVIYTAFEQGKKIKVYVDETRPLLQGARLTTWELMQRGIETILITDNMASYLMKLGKVDCVIVGADRVALNGDTANKIGTYGLAISAKYHGIPFYVACPTSSIDFNIKTGDEIPIEERGSEEIVEFMGKRIAPEGVKTFSPAFDVTPNDLISAIITEHGVIYPPFEENIRKLKEKISFRD
ncbi:MAG: S-methyl-5-thioribose-1-phosphate isomerase [Candidatus Kryptonium sp.]|nr:S-methyl-5-thioribose-1-phosphate isomerase [Candidatus Kryptonium sp.]MCX7762293.1 S-methyl-5-thioribose-1-phosphate isomerase [Candidatus Kryptonium sp.]MDW8109015.1 S-methyl-5-thioribose-1-phosphate isomerase [Candidatus Kryptonium sp.]